MLNLYQSDQPRNAPLFEIDSELNFGRKLKDKLLWRIWRSHVFRKSWVNSILWQLNFHSCHRVMKSLWNILDDEPLAVGYTYNNYVSVEFSFLFWLFLTWNAYSLWHCSSLALSSSLSMWSLLERLRYSLIFPSACSNWASNSASSSREPSWKKHKTLTHFYIQLLL